MSRLREEEEENLIREEEERRDEREKSKHIEMQDFCYSKYN